MLPQDPMMLLSVVNTALRDTYPTLTEYCQAEGCDEEKIVQTLAGVDYTYDKQLNRFV